MRINVLAIGTRTPDWVSAGVETYRKRLPKHIQLEFRSLPAETRNRSSAADRSRQIESDRLIKAIPAAAHTIALDEHGDAWSSTQLAKQMEHWMANSPQVALLIGGADGLSDSCKERADKLWSLSPLTLPHALVRVVLAEQLYRAWTLVQGHPYHRA